MIELTLRELSAQLCPAAKSTPPSPTFPTSAVLDVHVVKDSEHGLKELSLNYFYQIVQSVRPGGSEFWTMVTCTFSWLKPGGPEQMKTRVVSNY